MKAILERTPLCDEQALTVVIEYHEGESYVEEVKSRQGEYVPVEFARQLERDLAEWKRVADLMISPMSNTYENTRA